MRRRTRAVIVTAAACLVLGSPVSAPGHVTIAPPFVEAGLETAVGFEVPNERRGHATTSLSIVAPDGVTIDIDGLPDDRWTVRGTGDAMHWSGGRITGGRTTRFPARITARTPPGRIAFRVVQRYDDGKRVRWQAALTVVPGASAEESPPQHVGRALTAALAGLTVIGASLLALRRLRRRGSLQER